MAWVFKNDNGRISCYCQELNNSGVIQAFSTKSYGNLALHTGDVSAAVVERRRQFLSDYHLKLENLVSGEQVHRDRIALVTREDAGRGSVSLQDILPATDGLITREPGLVLAVFSADCLPVFIYDPVTPAIALVHAGWRGSIQKIAWLALMKMKQEFGTIPSACWVALGPSICQGCFEIGPEVAELFAKLDQESIKTSAVSSHVNLPLFNAKLLQKSGVPANQIIYSGICTDCQPEHFYSYRSKPGVTGRMMSIFALDSHGSNTSY